MPKGLTVLKTAQAVSINSGASRSKELRGKIVGTDKHAAGRKSPGLLLFCL